MASLLTMKKKTSQPHLSTPGYIWDRRREDLKMSDKLLGVITGPVFSFVNGQYGIDCLQNATFSFIFSSFPFLHSSGRDNFQVQDRLLCLTQNFISAKDLEDTIVSEVVF